MYPFNAIVRLLIKYAGIVVAILFALATLLFAIGTGLMNRDEVPESTPTVTAAPQ